MRFLSWASPPACVSVPCCASPYRMLGADGDQAFRGAVAISNAPVSHKSLTADRRTPCASLVPGMPGPHSIFYPARGLQCCDYGLWQPCVPARSIHHDDFPTGRHGRSNAKCFVGVSLLALESTSPFCGVRTSICSDGLLVQIPGLGAAP